jgi:hypothetical protein
MLVRLEEFDQEPSVLWEDKMIQVRPTQSYTTTAGSEP